MWVAPKTRVRASLLCYWRLCECMDWGDAGWALQGVHGRNSTLGGTQQGPAVALRSLSPHPILDGFPPCLPLLPHTGSAVKLLAANSRQQMDLMLLHIPQKQVAALKEMAAGALGGGWQEGS